MSETDAPGTAPAAEAAHQPQANGKAAGGAAQLEPAPARGELAAAVTAVPPGWLAALTRSPVVQLTACYMAVRGILLVADVYAAQMSYGGHLAGPVSSWDSHFYLGIAQHGYPATVVKVHGSYTYSPTAFLPMFPLLIRTLALTGLPVLGSAIIVSVLCGWAATVLVWRMATVIGGEALGFAAATLFMVFPGFAVAWGLVYCECAGTAFVAGALYMMLRGRWAWAGLLGACATATSPVALVLAPAALVPAVQMARRREFPTPVITALMTPAGMGGFVLWEAVKYHNLLFYWQLQREAWGFTIDWGQGLVTMLPHPFVRSFQGPSWLEAVALLAVALAGWAMWKAKLPGFMTAYVVLLALSLFISNEGLKPRLLTWGFPALIAVAARLKAPGRQFLTLVFVGLLPLLFLAFTTMGNTMTPP